MADEPIKEAVHHTDRNLALELVRVTEAAGLAASRWMGLGRKNEADGAAVEAMRLAFDSVAISGTVVIGEGEMDEAPMLYIGEKVGAGGPGDGHRGRSARGHHADRQGRPERAWPSWRWPSSGNFLHAPDIYMQKIAVGGGLPDGRRRHRRAGREEPAQPRPRQEVARCPISSPACSTATATTRSSPKPARPARASC